MRIAVGLLGLVEGGVELRGRLWGFTDRCGVLY